MMKRNLFGYLPAIAAAFALMGSAAQAGLTKVSDYYLAGPLGNGEAEAEFVANELGLTSIDFLKKYNWGDTPGFEGPSTGSFGVSPAGAKPLSADIQWDLTGTGFEGLAVLIKDGMTDQGMLYRLYTIDGDQSVSGTGTVTFAPENEKTLSHVSWFGAEAPETVPDGGWTLVLFGMSCLGLAAMRRAA